MGAPAVGFFILGGIWGQGVMSGMTVFQQFEKKEMARIRHVIPDFRPGDTLLVKSRDDEKARVQVFEGVCIARKRGGLNSSFTVRKVSEGTGVERVFPLYWPGIESITVLRQGKVRRAKLYYLRERFGKAARISEKKRVRPSDGPGEGRSAAPVSPEATSGPGSSL